MTNEQRDPAVDGGTDEATTTEQPRYRECPHPLSRIEWENDVRGDEVLTQPGECRACGAGVELVYQQVGVRLQHGSAGEFIHQF